MTIPAGICSGANASRPRVSVASTSKAPISALPHSSDTAAAQHKTRHMRRHQAHKAQAADAGDAGRGQQHRGEKAQHRQLLQTYAEADSDPVAQQRNVRRPGGTEPG